MQAALEQLRRDLEQALNAGRQPVLPAEIALFHCRRPQHLHQVPLHYPTLVVVLAGEKQLAASERQFAAQSGDLVLLPPGTWQMANIPLTGQRYLALALSFPSALLAHQEASWPVQRETYCLPAAADFALLLEQWLDLHQKHPMPAAWHASRQRELLHCLLASGQAGHLLRGVPALRDTLLALFYQDLRHDWQLGEVAARLHRSPSTLQRQLARENCRFGELLEEARLISALGLLQGSPLPIGLIAEQVGYLSPSRFSERFRQRFGLLPSALRQTQMTLAGEELTISGDPLPA